jgi:Tfp pilus assembly pilus retraction ATPase PilT
MTINPQGPQAPVKLSAYQFEDILLNIHNEDDVLLRGVRGASGKIVPPVVSPGEDLIDDIRGLRMRIASEQEGRVEFRLIHDEIPYRVTEFHSQSGRWYILRKTGKAVWSLSQLGLHPRLLSKLGQLGAPNGNRSGLILVSGDVHSGKTTTASSLLQGYVAAYGDIGYTVEAPVEYFLEGQCGKAGQIFQIECRSEADMDGTFERIVRCSPRYIYLGEIRTFDAAANAIMAARRGSLVISTIHGANIAAALQNIQTMACEKLKDATCPMLGEALLCILSQRLNGHTPSLHVPEFLFADDSVKQILRNGRFEQLGTAINQQRNALMASHSGAQS